MEVKEITITFDDEELKALKNICKVYLLCINSEVKNSSPHLNGLNPACLDFI